MIVIEPQVKTIFITRMAPRIALSSNMDDDESLLPPSPVKKPLHHDLSSNDSGPCSSNVSGMNSTGRRRADNKVSFSKRVKVFPVLHLGDYTEKEIKACWFSKRELSPQFFMPMPDPQRVKLLPPPSKEEAKIMALQNEIQRLLLLTRGTRSNKGTGGSNKNGEDTPSAEEAKIMELQSEINHLLQSKAGRISGSKSNQCKVEAMKGGMDPSCPPSTSGSGRSAFRFPELPSSLTSTQTTEESKILALQTNIHKLLVASTPTSSSSSLTSPRSKRQYRQGGGGDSEGQLLSPQRSSPRANAEGGGSKWSPCPNNDKSPLRPSRQRNVLGSGGNQRSSNGEGTTAVEERIMELQEQIRKSML